MERVDEYLWERNAYLAEIPGYDPTCEILYHNSWSDYEENGWTFVLRMDGRLYVLDYQYSVMSEDNEARWEPYPVTEDEALDHMLKWEEMLAEPGVLDFP